MTIKNRSRLVSRTSALQPIAPQSPLLTVLVPTRNERDNIQRLVVRIEAAVGDLEAELAFVDDSEDDTPSIIEALECRLPVSLVHRQPADRAGGLGTALALGLQRARGNFVCVLDADLQHPPEMLPQMLREATRLNADVVVASRYIKGGSAGALPRSRKLISVASKWLSKALFYEKLKTSDPGSGFFLIRRSVVEAATLRPIGYKMLTEVLMRGRWSTLAEVPYQFESRVAGTSKATVRQGIQYLQHTLRLFFDIPDAARFWKFLLVGGSGVVVNLGLFWSASVQAGMPNWAAWTAGVEASILSNFLINRSFTWRDRARRGPGVIRDGGRYHLVSFAGVIANGAVFSAGSLLGLPGMVAAFAGVSAGVICNFGGASAWVFQRADRLLPVQLLPASAPAQLEEQLAALPERRAA